MIGTAVGVVAYLLVSPGESRLPLPFRGTTLRAANPGSLTTEQAKVGSVYNLGVTLRVSGPEPVRLVDVTALESTPGLELLPGALLWGCDGAEVFGAVVAEDLARVPTARPRDPATALLRESDGSCWYGMVRLRPTRHGRLTAKDGMLRYLVGGREESARFDFDTVLDVTGEGPDPRDKSR